MQALAGKKHTHTHTHTQATCANSLVVCFTSSLPGFYPWPLRREEWSALPPAQHPIAPELPAFRERIRAGREGARRGRWRRKRGLKRGHLAEGGLRERQDQTPLVVQRDAVPSLNGDVVRGSSAWHFSSSLPRFFPTFFPSLFPNLPPCFLPLFQSHGTEDGGGSSLKLIRGI